MPTQNQTTRPAEDFKIHNPRYLPVEKLPLNDHGQCARFLFRGERHNPPEDAKVWFFGGFEPRRRSGSISVSDTYCTWAPEPDWVKDGMAEAKPEATDWQARAEKAERELAQRENTLREIAEIAWQIRKELNEGTFKFWQLESKQHQIHTLCGTLITPQATPTAAPETVSVDFPLTEKEIEEGLSCSVFRDTSFVHAALIQAKMALRLRAEAAKEGK